MCYNISYLTKKRLEYARRYGTNFDVEEIERDLERIGQKTGPVYYVNGFAHPDNLSARFMAEEIIILCLPSNKNAGIPFLNETPIPSSMTGRWFCTLFALYLFTIERI